MSLSSPNLHLLLVLLLLSSLSLLISSTHSSPLIGVTYSQAATNLPRPDRVVSALRSLHIPIVRLPDPHPDLIRAFSYSGISLLLSIPNSFVPNFASNRSTALHWLSAHVVPFHPRSRIAAISVGHDLLSPTTNLSKFLLPAIRNVYLSLHELGIRKISISTTHSFDVITTAFPPSDAQFQEPITESFIKPLLDFLAATNSSFLVNLYPYKVYRASPEIPIGYALFQEQPLDFRDDPVTGLRYRNLFDVMVDSVLTAMAVLGHEDIPVVVTETGWPSEGDETEPEATGLYAEMYGVRLARHLKSGLGTPLKRDGVAETYMYELFDEEGEGSVRHWGILYTNMTLKFGIGFSGSSCRRGGGMVVGFWLVVVFLLLQRKW